MDCLSSRRAFSPEMHRELRELESRFRRLRLGWIVPLALALTNVLATILSLQNA
jgi:hypothetical protein